MPAKNSSARPASSSQDRYTYIPPSVQAAMTKQMQSSVPANLKRYVGSEGNGYIPQNVQKSLTQHMQKTLPAHMRQYAGAYVQQNIVAPGMNRGLAQTKLTNRPPAPNPLRMDHSNVSAPQYEAQFHDDLFASDVQNQPLIAAAQEGASGRQTPYDFFLNDPPKQNKKLFGGGNSMKQRIIIFIIGASVLIILAVVVLSNVFSSPSTTDKYISLAQEQTEIARVAQIGVDKARSDAGENLAVTTSYAVTSQLNDVKAILSKKHKKYSTKLLGLKKSSATDQDLNSAALNNQFDDEFTKVIDQELATYQKDLKDLYDLTHSNSEKQTLANAYNAVNAILNPDAQTN